MDHWVRGFAVQQRKAAAGSAALAVAVARRPQWTCGAGLEVNGRLDGQVSSPAALSAKEPFDSFVDDPCPFEIAGLRKRREIGRHPGDYLSAWSIGPRLVHATAVGPRRQARFGYRFCLFWS